MRRSPGDHSRYALKCLIASSEPACWRWAPWRLMGKMQLDEPTHSRQFSISPRLSAVIPRRACRLASTSGDTPGSAQFKSPFQPCGGLGELAIVHEEVGN